MLKDKYLNLFLKSNGGYSVYYPLNIFRNKKTGEYLVVMHLDQLHASKYI